MQPVNTMKVRIFPPRHYEFQLEQDMNEFLQQSYVGEVKEIRYEFRVYPKEAYSTEGEYSALILYEEKVYDRRSR